MNNYMAEALALAEKAASLGEVPIGAVIVKNGDIIGRGHNMTETDKDPTAHAEMIAIRQAAHTLGGWRLSGCDMYVTCEPCCMCAGAIVWARIENLYIATPDPKAGACGSVFDIPASGKLNHTVKIEEGILQEESQKLLKDFFREIRNRKSEDL